MLAKRKSRNKKRWITWPKGREVCIADVLSGEWVRRSDERPAPPPQQLPPLRKILHSITTNSLDITTEKIFSNKLACHPNQTHPLNPQLLNPAAVQLFITPPPPHPPPRNCTAAVNVFRMGNSGNCLFR